MEQSHQSNASPAIFAGFVMLTFYSLGAGYLESFVNYPLWHVIGSTERWTAYHQALGPRIVIVLAIPALVLSLVANVLLFFHRPPAVPLWAISLTLALLIFATASTAAIQIPIQMQLDVAYDAAAVDKLMATSFWLRDVPGGVRAAIVCHLLHATVKASHPAGFGRTIAGPPQGGRYVPTASQLIEPSRR